MALTISERTALAAYDRAQTEIRETITHGVLPNIEKALRLYVAFSDSMADPANAALVEQYQGETAEIGLTQEDIGGLVVALQGLVESIHALDVKAGGNLFFLSEENEEAGE